VGRCHEKARFVCRLCVLEAPFQVDVAIHVMPLLPTLLQLCSMFIERLYRCAEDLRDFLRYKVVLGLATVRENSDSPGFCIVGSLSADFDVVACIVLADLEQNPEVKSCIPHLVAGEKHTPRVAASHFIRQTWHGRLRQYRARSASAVSKRRAVFLKLRGAQAHAKESHATSIGSKWYLMMVEKDEKRAKLTDSIRREGCSRKLHRRHTASSLVRRSQRMSLSPSLSCHLLDILAMAGNLACKGTWCADL
jgi:hypothetical protein